MYSCDSVCRRQKGIFIILQIYMFKYTYMYTYMYCNCNFYMCTKYPRTSSSEERCNTVKHMHTHLATVSPHLYYIFPVFPAESGFPGTANVTIPNFSSSQGNGSPAINRKLAETVAFNAKRGSIAPVCFMKSLINLGNQKTVSATH